MLFLEVYHGVRSLRSMALPVWARPPSRKYKNSAMNFPHITVIPQDISKFEGFNH